jgi:hypothetical protein
MLVNSSIKTSWGIEVDEPHIKNILLRWAMRQKKGNHEKNRSFRFPKHLNTLRQEKVACLKVEANPKLDEVKDMEMSNQFGDIITNS